MDQKQTIVKRVIQRIEKIRSDLQEGFDAGTLEDKDKCLTEVKEELLKMYANIEFLNKLI